MKTLILIGSPRKNGDTAFLLNQLLSDLKSEVKIVHAYSSHIAACNDCRYCFKNEGCIIQDEMQEVYEYINTCDNIILSSPVYFSALTGQLLNIASRLQCYFAAKFIRNSPIAIKPKRGVLILCGGGNGSSEPAKVSADLIFKSLKAEKIAEVCSLHTDTIAVKDDIEAIKAAKEAAILINESSDK